MPKTLRLTPEQALHNRGLLAFMTTEPVPATVGNWQRRYIGREVLQLPFCSGEPAKKITVSPPEIKDPKNGLLMISVPITHRLMGDKDDQPQKIFNPADFKTIIGEDYLAFAGMHLGSGSTIVPADATIMVSPPDLQTMTISALGILSDPALAEDTLGISGEQYQKDLANPQSDLSKMVAAIASNGGLTKGDWLLNSLTERANREGNAAFAARVETIGNNLPKKTRASRVSTGRTGATSSMRGS